MNHETQQHSFEEAIEKELIKEKKEVKHWAHKALHFAKAHKIITGIGLIVTIAVIAGALKPTPPPEFTAITTERMNLLQTVEETGTLKSNIEINYGFEKTGRVVSVVKKSGNYVKKGEVIAVLDNAQERNSLAQASAQLQAAQAQLNLRLVGISDSEKAKYQAAIDQAQAQYDKTKASALQSVDAAKLSLETAENNLQKASGGDQSEIVEDAYTDLINTLKGTSAIVRTVLKATDDVIGVENQSANASFAPQLGYDSNGTYHDNLKQESRNTYFSTRDKLVNLESELVFLTGASDHSKIDLLGLNSLSLLSETERHIFAVLQLLDYTAPKTNVLSSTQKNTLVAAVNTVYTSVATQRTSVSNSRQAVQAAKTSLTGYEIAYQKALSDYLLKQKQADADIAYAQATLDQARANYNVATVPPRDVDVASLRADVSRLRAGVAIAKDNYDKTILVALADGVIGNLDVNLGEVVIANEKILSILSNDYSVEVDISESDIVKLAAGQQVHFTLDAFGKDVVFTGTVAAIDPAQKEISGVIYYKTTISLDDYPKERYDLKTGMTANITIDTDMREDVITVPQRAILSDEEGEYVRVIKEGKTFVFEPVYIETGMRGNDGLIEVISGLSEGQQVITFLKTND